MIMADYDTILQGPAFANLQPEQKKFLKDIIARIEGKNSVEALFIIGEAVKKMPPGQSFTREEQDIMINAMLEGMSETERTKMSTLLKMMEGFRK